MAKYTITLEEARGLMSDEQKQRERDIFALVDDVVYREVIEKVYSLKFGDYEILNGTPLGYLNDFEKHMLFHRDEINALVSTLSKGEYYNVVYNELEITDSGKDTDTRTPNLTVKSGGTTKFYDTPDTANPAENQYLSNLTNSSADTTESGSDTTTRVYGKKTTHTRTIPQKALYELITSTPNSVIEYILNMFKPCFMLIF